MIPIIAQSRRLIGGDHGLAELALPRRDKRHRRKVAAGYYEYLDLGPIDPRECVARILRTQLADHVGIGRRKAFQRHHLQPVLALIVLLRPLDHRRRIGRHQRDPSRAQRLHRLADRLRRGDRRHARRRAHALRRDRIVVVGEQAGRCLRQTDHLHLRRAEQPRLIVHVLVFARCERAGAAGQQPPDMRLQRRRQQPAVLDLHRRVGRRNENAEMVCHVPDPSPSCPILTHSRRMRRRRP